MAVGSQAEATRLREEARDHMRASRKHRRRAQELMRQLDELRVACAARGIQITINRQDPSGGPSGQENEKDRPAER